MILYIDACVRAASRTKRLADFLLNTLQKPYERLDLANLTFPRVDEAFLDKRDRLIRNGSFDDEVFRYARQFADADEIVIAAPFWDLSFPSVIKAYLEQITVVGITFRYTPEGITVGMCKAKRLVYVTTAGGDFFPDSYGFGYVKALAQSFFGIKDVTLIQATGLDIIGAPVEKILAECEADIVRRFRPE